ncbi:MAG: hypothetical protein COA69_13545 [Robiginitomaculum sp.]|nr:MAG: hypothetical protein COA69_13545 [Robiginitomaculum sp.]
MTGTHQEAGSAGARPGMQHEASREEMAGALGEAEQINTTLYADPIPGDDKLIKKRMYSPGDWEPDMLGLPPECPVTPLGYDDDIKYFLTPVGTIGTISSTRGGKKVIVNLFITRNNYLAWAWPLPSKSDPGRFNAEVTERAMIEACGRKGAWNPMDKVKGRGAHLNEHFKLVYNSGRWVYVENFESKYPTGEIGKYLYPGRPAALEPWPDPVLPSGNGLISHLLDMLETWNWKRGHFDADMLLGWIGCAFLGGALPWRPHVFMTGERGTGKSTLQALVGHVMGDGLIMAADTTAAGIYQALKNDTIAVAIDELEAEADDRATQKVLELARISSSGGKALRGGAEHKGVEFTLRSCFLMSAINVPALKPQDRSRITMLSLNPIVDISGGPNIDGTKLKRVGQQVLRRMMDGWPLYSDVFYAYRKALIEGCGLDSRGGDQYGSLIAAHHILTCDGPARPDQIEHWVRRVREQLENDYSGSIRNWEGCLNHLLDTTVDAWRNTPVSTVRAVLHREFVNDGEDKNLGKCRRKLGEIGCSLVFGKNIHNFENAYLFVPANHAQLSALFAQSVWRSTGAAQGVWHETLSQAPERVAMVDKAKVLGASKHGHKIHIREFMNFD